MTSLESQMEGSAGVAVAASYPDAGPAPPRLLLPSPSPSPLRRFEDARWWGKFCAGPDRTARASSVLPSSSAWEEGDDGWRAREEEEVVEVVAPTLSAFSFAKEYTYSNIYIITDM